MSKKVKLRYVGPHDEVELEDADGSWHAVPQGGEKEFDEKVAAGLLEQESNWERAGASRSKKSEEGK